MKRLPLFFFLCAVLVPRPASAARTEAEAVAEARAQAKRGCRDAPASCAEIRDLLGGYLEWLEAAKECLVQPCVAYKISEALGQVARLDEREHGLPDAARADGSGRPLLRLSLLVAERLAAALASADPKWPAPVRADFEVYAPQLVESLCEEPTLCPAARQVLDAGVAVKNGVEKCAAHPCAYEELERYAVADEKAQGDYMALSNEAAHLRPKVDTIALWVVLKDDGELLTAVLARDSRERLERLEGKVDALDRALDGASAAGAPALRAQLAEATALFQQASIGSDRAMSFAPLDAADPLRTRLNVAAGRLTSERARVLALATAQGLAPESSDAVPASAGRPRAAAAAGAGAAGAGKGLDRGVVAAPAAAASAAPPILDGDPSFYALGRRLLSSQDPLERADAARRLGLSKTIGDPGGRAALVHGQTYGDDCAVVTQQEALLSLGLLPPSDPVRQETELRQEARERGFLAGGTSPAYSGDLLIVRGVLAVKRVGAPLEELDGAVRRGGLVIAGIDARWLWTPAYLKGAGKSAADVDAVAKSSGSDPNPEGHSIVVTGAEIDRWSGVTTGYYVNDSGINPPGRGRFIPAETFKKMWENGIRSYVEVR